MLLWPCTRRSKHGHRGARLLDVSDLYSNTEVEVEVEVDIVLL